MRSNLYMGTHALLVFWAGWVSALDCIAYLHNMYMKDHLLFSHISTKWSKHDRPYILLTRGVQCKE